MRTSLSSAMWNLGSRRNMGGFLVWLYLNHFFDLVLLLWTVKIPAFNVFEGLTRDIYDFLKLFFSALFSLFWHCFSFLKDAYFLLLTTSVFLLICSKLPFASGFVFFFNFCKVVFMCLQLGLLKCYQQKIELSAVWPNSFLSYCFLLKSLSWSKHAVVSKYVMVAVTVLFLHTTQNKVQRCFLILQPNVMLLHENLDLCLKFYSWARLWYGLWLSRFYGGSWSLPYLLYSLAS